MTNGAIPSCHISRGIYSVTIFLEITLNLLKLLLLWTSQMKRIINYKVNMKGKAKLLIKKCDLYREL